MDLVFAIGGCLLFSGYIVYDTYIINAKLSPDEFIMGAISLYLEYVNLSLDECLVANLFTSQFYQSLYASFLLFRFYILTFI